MPLLLLEKLFKKKENLEGDLGRKSEEKKLEDKGGVQEGDEDNK